MSAWPLCLPVKALLGFWGRWRLLVVAAAASVCAACQQGPHPADVPRPVAAHVPAPAEEAEPTALPEGPPRPPAEPPIETLPEPPQLPREEPVKALPEEELPVEQEPTLALPLAFASAQPELVSRPVPVFPDWADFDEIIGAVARFRVWIDEEGTVQRVELIDATTEVIVDPVRTALLASRYTPVLTPDGFPVRVSFEETVAF